MKYLILHDPYQQAYQIRWSLFMDLRQPEHQFHTSQYGEMMHLAHIYGAVSRLIDPDCETTTLLEFRPVIEGSSATLANEGEPFEWMPDTFYADPSSHMNAAVAREMCRVLRELADMCLEQQIVMTIPAAIEVA